MDANRWQKYTWWKIETGIDAVEWAREVNKRGPGELLIKSMDSDGTKAGFDND